MPDKARKFAWFQVHLSTAVVLMFTAGVLVWANVRPQSGTIILQIGKAGMAENSFTTENVSEILARLKGEYWGGFKGVGYGWPMNARAKSEYVRPGDDVNDRIRDTWHPGAICADVLVALAILAGVAAGSEWWIRRAQRKA